MGKFFFQPNGLTPSIFSITALLIMLFSWHDRLDLSFYYQLNIALLLLTFILDKTPWYGRLYGPDRGIRDHLSKSFMLSLYCFHIIFVLKFFTPYWWISLPFFLLGLFFQYVSCAMLYFHFILDPGPKTPNFLTRKN